MEPKKYIENLQYPVAEKDNCVVYIDQDMIVEALVTVKPKVSCKDYAEICIDNTEIEKIEKKKPRRKVKTKCYKRPMTERDYQNIYKGHQRNESSIDVFDYHIKQELSLKIPIVFEAEANVVSKGAVCDVPKIQSGK